MLSTSILSKPRGPSELFTMFEIANAAVTNACRSIRTRARSTFSIDGTDHFDHGFLVLTRDLLRGRRLLEDPVGTFHEDAGIEKYCNSARRNVLNATSATTMLLHGDRSAFEVLSISLSKELAETGPRFSF